MIQQAKVSLIKILMQTWHYLCFTELGTLFCGCSLKSIYWSWMNIETALLLFLVKSYRILCWTFAYFLPCLSKRSQLSLQQSRSGIFQWNVRLSGNNDSQKPRHFAEIIPIQQNLADTAQSRENGWSCNSQTCNFPLPPLPIVLEPLKEFFFISKKPAGAFVLSWNNRFSGFLFKWNFKVSVVHFWGTSKFEQIYPAIDCYV